MFFKITTRIEKFIIILFLNLLFFGGSLFSQTDTTSVALEADTLKSDTLSIPAFSDSLTETSKDTVSIQEDILPILGIDTTEITTELKIDSTQIFIDTTSIFAPTTLTRDSITKFEPEGYRGVLWGMTLDEVQTKTMDLENFGINDLFPTRNGFEYTQTLNDRPTLMTYQFDNDRLYIVRLLPRIFSKRKADYMDAFDEYYDVLQRKYDAPTRNGFLKKDRSYQNTIEAVLLGYAKRYAVWDFKRTQIILLMKGIFIGDPLNQKRGLQISISYTSKMILNEIRERRAILKQEEF